MFCAIIGRSTHLGFKAGLAAGVSYYPVFLVFYFIIGTAWNLAHPSPHNHVTLDDVKNIGHNGPPVGFMLFVLLFAAAGGLVGTLLGFLNGVFIASANTVIAVDPSQNRFYRYVIVTVCVMLSLIGTAYFLHLLFATDLFTNFSDPGTPDKPTGPTRMIGLLQDPQTVELFIDLPSLLAGVAAWWLSRRVLAWIAASAVTLQGFVDSPKEPLSVDHLWPL